MADQGTYTATNLPTDGKTIQAADVNTDLQGLIDEFNKNVGTTKITDSAVTASKLSPSAITLGYAQSVSSQSGITAQVDLTSLTVTVTVPSNSRNIKITGYVIMTSTVSTDHGVLYIFEGSTQLNAALNVIGSGGGGSSIIAQVVLQNVAAGSHTYKLQGQMAGSGTGATGSSTTQPAFILVEAI